MNPKHLRSFSERFCYFRHFVEIFANLGEKNRKFRKTMARGTSEAIRDFTNCFTRAPGHFFRNFSKFSPNLAKIPKNEPRSTNEATLDFQNRSSAAAARKMARKSSWIATQRTWNLRLLG